MLDILIGFSAFLTLLVAPVLLYISWRYRKRTRDVLYQWKKPEMVLITITTFIINLSLFIITLIFVFSDMLHLKGLQIDFEKWEGLPLLTSTLLTGITIFYFACSNFLTQTISIRGIVVDSPEMLFASKNPQILTWDEIRDYYMVSDFPSTVFNFTILSEEGEYSRFRLKVPFYAIAAFREMLDVRFRMDEAETEDIPSDLSRFFN